MRARRHRCCGLPAGRGCELCATGGMHPHQQRYSARFSAAELLEPQRLYAHTPPLKAVNVAPASIASAVPVTTLL